MNLDCPSGAEPQGELPPRGLEQSCVKVLSDGTKLLHGPYRSWYSSRIKESEGEYRDGLRQGVWYFWHANGMPRERGFYDHGQRQGEWAFCLPALDTYRHFFVTYRDDVENGPWRSFHLEAPGTEPQMTEEEGGVVGGQRHGPWKAFYPNGHRYAEAEYVYGQLRGLAQYWYESGNPKEAGEYRDGLREGEWTEWEEQARGSRKGVYVGGAKDGVWREYDENERVVQIVTYKNGEVVATETPAAVAAPAEALTEKGSAAAKASALPAKK